MPIQITPGGRLMPTSRTRNEEVDFWDRVKKGSEEECWEWIGGVSGNGYGRLRFRRVQSSAHRVAAFLTKQVMPGDQVLHKCDNRRCCNPNHLFLGTAKDNQQDCISKGRKNTASGFALPQTRLSDEQVAVIRGNKESAKVVAIRFGICEKYVGEIRRGKKRSRLP